MIDQDADYRQSETFAGRSPRPSLTHRELRAQILSQCDEHGFRRIHRLALALIGERHVEP
jgi:hypothetical protein